MDKYIEIEKRLALLLGWTCESDSEGAQPVWRSTTRHPAFIRGEVPVYWCQMPTGVVGLFSLMVEHKCFPATTEADEGFGCVRAVCRGASHKAFLEVVDHHPSAEIATKFALCRALVYKLENENVKTK